MIISLIGFSGTGKSHWARQLATELGFENYCCDKIIEKKLNEAKLFSGSGIHAVADWMGMPYSENFDEREQQYLNFEKEVLDETLQTLSSTTLSRPVVIDTTGSVIYTGETRCKQLQEISKVVYLDVDEGKIDQMLSQFISKPKPIVWNKIFSQNAEESQEEALKRSYRELLLSRKDLYNKYAEITLPYSTHKKKHLSSREFIELVSSNEIS